MDYNLGGVGFCEKGGLGVLAALVLGSGDRWSRECSRGISDALLVIRGLFLIRWSLGVV